ncbi:MAG TPA: LLM class flavin-dependent oxidoreductase [Candidatus Methylomirabilis sp.]|nr:LLM class flavin-dependent oxidoreductase [Candidatus Methylomirabilis sp.]
MEVAVALDIVWPESRLRRLARVADEHGYDQLWISDHPLGRDPFLALLDLARYVDRIRLGIATINTSARHPAILAASAATLSLYTPGRFWLGLGSSNASLLGPIGLAASQQAQRCRDAVVIIRQLLEEGGSTVSSTLHTTRDARLLLSGVSPVPVLVGTSGGPAMLRVSGQVAHGIIVPAGNLGLYRYVIETFREAYRASGRAAAPYIVLLANVAVATAPDAMIAFMRPRVAQTIAYRAKSGHALPHMGITGEQAQAWADRPETLPDAVVRDAAMIGTPTECLDGLQRFASMGVTQLVLRFPDETTIREFGIHVLPRFRAQRHTESVHGAA